MNVATADELELRLIDLQRRVIESEKALERTEKQVGAIFDAAKTQALAIIEAAQNDALRIVLAQHTAAAAPN
jgi:hypothetical protein